MTRYLTNFTAEALEEFATAPDEPDAPQAEPASDASGPTGEAGSSNEEPAKPEPVPTKPKAPLKKPAPAPVESQGTPPPLTMEKT